MDLIVQARLMDKKARSLEELSLVLEKSRAHGQPAITVWIHEDLADVAQALWQMP